MATSITLRDILTDVTASDGHRYALRDSAGNTMDTLKVIANPTGGYLGIYHTGDHVKLADSNDLLTWTFRQTLDPAATQPTIAALPAGDFLTAVEYNNHNGSGGLLRLRYYPTIASLYAGKFTRERTIPRTLSACNEGTPSIESVALLPDIDNSTIELGFHYQRRCDVDRQAVGSLTGFTNWSAVADTDLDEALAVAAAVRRHRIKGNIGGRDRVTFDDVDYTLVEVQYTRHDFSSWHIYLRTGPGSGPDSASGTDQAGPAGERDARPPKRIAGRIDDMPITTHRGSTAFANPTVTNLIAPSGRPAIVATVFLPSESAASGEAGQLLYYREYRMLPRSGPPGEP